MNSDPFGYAWIKEKYSIQRREIAKHTIGRRNIRQKIILIINPSQETNMRTNMYQEFGIAHSKICLSVPQTNTCIPRDFSYNFKATFDIRACNHLLSKGLGMILQEMSARSCLQGHMMTFITPTHTLDIRLDLFPHLHLSIDPSHQFPCIPVIECKELMIAINTQTASSIETSNSHRQLNGSNFLEIFEESQDILALSISSSF